jgi:hypothetical protein
MQNITVKVYHSETLFVGISEIISHGLFFKKGGSGIISNLTCCLKKPDISKRKKHSYVLNGRKYTHPFYVIAIGYLDNGEALSVILNSGFNLQFFTHEKFRKQGISKTIYNQLINDIPALNHSVPIYGLTASTTKILQKIGVLIETNASAKSTGRPVRLKVNRTLLTKKIYACVFNQRFGIKPYGKQHIY